MGHVRGSGIGVVLLTSLLAAAVAGQSGDADPFAWLTPSVRVEAHVGNGLPAFHIVGLPEAEVREARDRVRAALATSRLSFPQSRVTDHRIGVDARLQDVLAGDLDRFTEALTTEERRRSLGE